MEVASSEECDQMVMLDTGAGVSVCPKNCFEFCPITPMDEDHTLKTASGSSIKSFGQRNVKFYFANVGKITVKFIVASVTRPLLSMKDLVGNNCSVLLSGQNSFINVQGR